jgi:quercetin dioxygenase-like cupin family protein
MDNRSHAAVQLENEFFRVTKWTIEPGGAIPMHRHDFEYVVVPVVDAQMSVVSPDGTEFVAHITTGESYTRAAGSEHRIENRSSEVTVEFVEIERLA